MGLSKRCTKCDTEQPLSNFHKESRRPSGYQCWCKDCENSYRRNSYRYKEKAAIARKLWHARNKAEHNRKIRLAEVKKKYGISESEYGFILAHQGGCCGLCGTNEPRGKGSWHVDHCHESGRVRGLLCHTCNTFLGIYQKLEKTIGADEIRRWLNRDPLGMLSLDAGATVNTDLGLIN